MDEPQFKLETAAALVGVHEGALRTWIARSPDHGLGTYAGRAALLSKRELFIVALWAALIGYGLGPPHRALKIAKQIAAVRVEPILFVIRDRRERIHITKRPDHRPAVALPTAAIWQRIAAL